MIASLDAIVSDLEKKWQAERLFCGDSRAGYVCTRPKGHEGDHAWMAAQRDSQGVLTIVTWLPDGPRG